MNLPLSLSIAKQKSNADDNHVAIACGTSISQIRRLKSTMNWSSTSIERVADAFGMSCSEFVALGEKLNTDKGAA